MTRKVIERTQKSRGSSRGFGGPDVYVAGLEIPEGLARRNECY